MDQNFCVYKRIVTGNQFFHSCLLTGLLGALAGRNLTSECAA